MSRGELFCGRLAAAKWFKDTPPHETDLEIGKREFDGLHVVKQQKEKKAKESLDIGKFMIHL